MKIKHRLQLLSFACVLFFGAAHAKSIECTPGNPPSAFYSFDSVSSPIENSIAADNGSSTSIALVAGVNGRALSTNNKSEITLAKLPFNSRAQLSISLWVKPSNLQNAEARFVSQATGISNDEHYVMASAFDGSALRFRLKAGGVTTTLISKPGLLKAGQWSHTAYTYDSTKMQIWHNGAVVASVAKRGQIDSPLNVPFAIAGQPAGSGSRPFTGAIDDLVFFDRALSSTLIDNLANRRNNNCTITQQELPAVATQQVTAAQEVSLADSSAKGNVVGGVRPVTQLSEVAQSVGQDQQEFAEVVVDSSTRELQIGQASNQLPSGNWADAAAAGFYDESVPMAGVFVGGAPDAGVFGAANTLGGRHIKVRFRSPRTGFLESFTTQNRINAVSSNFSRTYDPKYAEGREYFASQGVVLTNNDTQENREIAARIAWMIGGYYSAGNGGSQIFEVWTDVNGQPGEMIATTSKPFIGINYSSDFYDHMFDSPAPVTAGKFYHVIIKNLTPPAVDAKIRNLTAEEAFNMPVDVGMFGLNGIQFADKADVANQNGPFFAGHTTSASDDITNPTNWNDDVNTIGWWGATYTTGEFIGQTEGMYGTLSIGKLDGNSGSMYIEGARHARQLITAPNNTTVDGVWLQHGQRAGSNGQPLLVELKDTAGAVLATANIPYNAAVAAAFDDGGKFDKLSNVWSYQSLNQAVDLKENTDYYLEFSAPAGAGFVFMSLNTYSQSHERTSEYVGNGVLGGAQRSEDSGGKWGQFGGSSSVGGSSRHLQTLLTVQGMPRSLEE